MYRPISVALVTSLLLSDVFAFLPPEAISLSPKTWLQRDFQRLEAFSQKRPKPLAFSDGKGMVAGTSSAHAVHGGTQVLRKGGNAMDACLTTALTEIVLSAGSHLSYAGAANILYYDSSTGDTHNLDAGWNKPYYIDPAQIPEYHSELGNGATVLVPGFIAGVSTASEKYGLLPLSKLLEPALYFASKGFKLPSELADEIGKSYNKRGLLRTKEGKQIFTNPRTKKPYKAGERFRQPKLAKFLKRLSKYGKDYFYRGPWAEDMVETIQSHEGYVTMEDMIEYQVKSHEPASTLYQGYHVLTSGAEWGGAELVETLKLMELAGIGDSTDSYLTNATKLYWLASITRLSSFISFFTHAVPNGKQMLKEHLNMDVDDSYRKTKDAAEELWNKIASPEKMAEMNDIMQEMLANAETAMEQHPRGSSGVVAVDSAGNVCSMVHGTDSEIWGTGLFVQGVSLPSAGIALKSLLKTTKSGKRLPSGFQPVIIFKEEPREFDGFSRRLRRDTSFVKKNKKRLAAKKKGISNRKYTMVEVPHKLVVIRKQNTVRSQLLDAESLAQASHWGETQQRHRLEHLAKSAELSEHDLPEYSDADLPDELAFTRRTQEEEEETEMLEEINTPIQEIESITSSEEQEEFEEMYPTDPFPLTTPRHHHVKDEHTDVTPNPLDGKEEREEEEAEQKEEIMETEEPTEEEETLEKDTKHMEEKEAKEFPHMGIPDPGVTLNHLDGKEEREEEETKLEEEIIETEETTEDDETPEKEIMEEEESKEFPHLGIPDAGVTSNHLDGKQEREEEETELEEEIKENEGPTEYDETPEKEITEEEESKEFPHLGIPDDWKSGTAFEEVDEHTFRTGLVPVLALACTGPSHSHVIPQYLTNILDSGMNPKAALEAPTFLAPSPHSFQQDIQVEKYSIDENVLQDANEFGQLVTDVDSQTAEEVAGSGAVITLNSDRKMLGCTHPSKGGLAEGVKEIEG